MTHHIFSIAKSPKDDRDDSDADFDLLFGSEDAPNDTYHRTHHGILFDGKRSASYAVACLNACRGLSLDELTELGHGGVERKIRALGTEVSLQREKREQAEAITRAMNSQNVRISNDLACTLAALVYLMNEARLSDLGETNNALVKAEVTFNAMMNRYQFGEV